ncbi:MAG: glycosyltransferase family 39 protein, partial [Flavobacteriales bacterium]|nr:glycosyltransferase family 39 protein [Flavobacteriales bacterium]
FGTSVAIVRLPFVLAGIAAIYFVFRLGKDWVSTSTGLLSAACFAILIFPLLYSRIARPYALGMLFSVMATSYWIRIVKDQYSFKGLVWLAISLALCTYTHYFCGLVAAVLAITGTFIIKGRTLKSYVLVLAGAFVLFLPHIPIFLHQLSLGGIGQWLGPPENDWLWQHVKYVFNDSWIVLTVVITSSIIGFLVHRPKWNSQNILLPLVLFLLPFAIGFSYSKWINPVMQNSTLLFSFPFLLILFFSGWRDTKPLLTKVMAAIVIIILMLSTLIDKQFFKTNHFGVFKEVAENFVEWNEGIEHETLLVGDFNHPFYIHYYLDKLGDIKLDQYRTTDDYGLIRLKGLVESKPGEHLIYGWSTVNQLAEVECIIKEIFPEEIKRESYFNSETVLFKRGDSPTPDHIFKFEKNERWNFSQNAVVEDSLNGKSILISSENPYGPSVTLRVSELESQGFTELVVRVECQVSDNNSALQMVYEQANEDGGYAWESDRFSKQFDIDGPKWGVFHYELKPSVSEADVLKIYPWLPEGNPAVLTTMQIDLY